MNRHVNAISGRLSLRPPQRRSLEILDRITEISPPAKNSDVQAALDSIQREFPSVTDFEREFPSLCFALATGVGKTRLMGAFIGYLHLAHGFNNFFVLAPNLTIYNKLITDFTPNTPKYVFTGIAEFATESAALITYEVIKQLENQPQKLPSITHVTKPEIQAEIVREVTERYSPAQIGLEGIVETPDIAAIVAKTSELTAQQTIDIPRILVVPKEEVKSGFKSFELDLSNVNYQPISNDLWAQELRTGKLQLITLGEGGIDEGRLEDYVVSGLVDFNDVSYDDNADLLYDLASQVVQHFRSYLSEEDAGRILRVYQREIARLVHVQMQEHYWEEKVDYEVRISKGFSELKPRSFIRIVGEPVLDHRHSPPDKSNMARHLFGGFRRSLYPEVKFESDSERKLSVILEREAKRWFKPARGQFLIYYRWNSEHPEYQPDFVAETEDTIYMLEPKAKNEMDDPQVLAKSEVAVTWCQHASVNAAKHGGKPWKYLLIPHDAISENMTKFQSCFLASAPSSSAQRQLQHFSAGLRRAESISTDSSTGNTGTQFLARISGLSGKSCLTPPLETE